MDSPSKTPDDDVSGTTITEYQKLVMDLSALLEAIEARIPRLEAPHRSTTAFVRSHRTVPKGFIASTIAAVEGEEELQRIGKFDPIAGRDALQFIQAFRPFADRISALLTALRFTIELRQAEAASGALQLYAVAKALARDVSSASLGPHVEILRRDLHRQKRRTRPSAPPDETADAGS